MNGLTGWDWFVLIVSLVSIGLGALRGLVRSVFAIAAWIVAFLGTPLAGAALLGTLSPQSGGMWVYAVAFAVLFIAVRVLGALAAGGLRRAGLGTVDRALGAVLGVVRAVVLIAVAVVAASVLGWDREPAWQQAQVRPLLEALLARIEPHLPQPVGGLRRA